MGDDLQQRLEGLRELQRRQRTCAHSDDSWSYVANRIANGVLQVWRRCDACGANRSGAGRFVPHDDLLASGIDIDALPIVHDDVARRSPCRVCGARSEPRHGALPGASAGGGDVWPTDYLCCACQNRWHLALARGPAGSRDVSSPCGAVGTAPDRRKRSQA